MKTWVLIGWMLATALPAFAQEEEETNRHAMTFSLSPTAAEVTGGTYTAADLIVKNSGTTPDGTLWDGATALGLPLGANVDAASDGTDYIPCDGPATCREVLYEVTVAPGSSGAIGSVVEAEATSDGAASDVFGTVERISGGTATYFRYVTSDALGVNPASDVDALLWDESGEDVIYFSVDGPTAAALGVSPADILRTTASGPVVWQSESSLGLAAGDDIDGLSVDVQHGCVALSLTPGSASLMAPGPWPGTSPGTTRSAADLISVKPGIGIVGVLAFPDKLGLAPGDDVNGVRVTDPSRKKCRDAFLMAGAFPAEELRINGSSGNVRHVVRMKCGDAGVMTVKPFHPAGVVLLFYSLGRPCDGQITYFPPGSDYFSFVPTTVLLPPTMLPGGVLSIPFNSAQLPCPLNLTMQGAVSGPPVLHVTNMVTLQVHP